MTRLKLLALVAAAVPLFAISPAAANQLLNPGFETDAVLDQPPTAFVDGWSPFNNAGTASATLAPVRTGIGSLVLPGGGGFGVPGAFQTFPASPGQTWDLQGYMLTKDALPAGATFGLLKIVFGDGTADLPPGPINIGQPGPAANPGIESLPFLNSASPTNTWQFTHAQGVAPAGTKEVRLFALFVDENAGTVYVDDVQALLAGDFDEDLDIDGDDLTIWKGANPQSADADADGDHDSDGADFLLWQKSFGLGPTVVAATVPEPASGLLLAIGLAMAGRRRIHRRSN